MEKNCIIHCRVSTTKQAQEGESLDLQEQICRRIAAARGARVLRVWREPFSGRRDFRPVLNDMFDYVKTSPVPIHYLIFRDIDRFTRAGSPLYRQTKDMLASHGVELVDSYGMIQPAVNTLAHLDVEFPWSRFSPSEMAETMKADMSRDEVRTILTRLIGAEIQLTRQGYQIGQSCDGFVNKRIYVDGRKKCIQVPDPERAKYLVAMFELRATGVLSDPDIVAKVNAMGFRTRTRRRWAAGQEEVIGSAGGTPLTAKRLQTTVRQLNYCGVICEKWTNYRPIRAQYPGLVSVETFNRANRGDVYLEEYRDGTLGVLYNHHPERQIKKKNRNHPLFPYKWIRCPRCDEPFVGSEPRGKSGKRFPVYCCQRKHKYLGIPKKTFDAVVEGFLANLRFAQRVADRLEVALLQQHRARQQEMSSFAVDVARTVADLKSEKDAAVSALIKAESEVVRAEVEKRVEALEERIVATQKERSEVQLQEVEIKEFIGYVRRLFEHPARVLISSGNPQLQKVLLGLVFDNMPTYEDLVNRTPQLSFMFQLFRAFENENADVVRETGLEMNTLSQTITRWRDVFRALDAGADSSTQQPQN